jgi:uncharacterized NAD(P)/FAD-binding protein YdhS
MQNIKELAIVGDGFAAAVMAIHLLRQGLDSSKLVLIGLGPLGKGNAYSCISPFFRLNVREDLPAVFSEDPLHFARWAVANIDDAEAKTNAGFFYRRYDYGRYISQIFADELGSDQIEHIQKKVTNLCEVDGLWHLEVNNCDTLFAKRVILATGNPLPVWPCAVKNEPALMSSARLIESPWTGRDLSAIDVDEEILLLGGGLTALDAINALVGQGHRGLIKVIGPRAVFPPTQASWQRQHQPNWPQKLTPAELVRFMRSYLPSTPTTSAQWQSAWEELRPNLSFIWQQFSVQQRRTLFRRLGWLWSLYRFRASPQTMQAYKQLEANKQIQLILGRAQQIDAEHRVKVSLGNGSMVEGDRILNCTGVGKDQLLGKLIDNRIAEPDALGQSIAVDSRFRVFKSMNEQWNTLWMIGPATMGSLGDVIAASSIAKQAEQLAIQITGDM